MEVSFLQVHFSIILFVSVFSNYCVWIFHMLFYLHKVASLEHLIYCVNASFVEIAQFTGFFFKFCKLLWLALHELKLTNDWPTLFSWECHWALSLHAFCKLVYSQKSLDTWILDCGHRWRKSLYDFCRLTYFQIIRILTELCKYFLWWGCSWVLFI